MTSARVKLFLCLTDPEHPFYCPYQEDGGNQDYKNKDNIRDSNIKFRCLYQIVIQKFLYSHIIEMMCYSKGNIRIIDFVYKLARRNLTPMNLFGMKRN